MIALARILVPTNLGEPSKAAIKYGVALAEQFNAQLFLLHVLRREDYDDAIEAERVLEQLAPDDPASGARSQDEVVRTVAKADLRRLLEPGEEQATRAEYLLRPAGPDGPHAAIAECAREKAIELIVMGKHGLGRVERMLGGSVGERLLRLTPCPVLVVRHPAHDLVPAADTGHRVEN